MSPNRSCAHWSLESCGHPEQQPFRLPARVIAQTIGPYVRENRKSEAMCVVEAREACKESKPAEVTDFLRCLKVSEEDQRVASLGLGQGLQTVGSYEV